MLGKIPKYLTKPKFTYNPVHSDDIATAVDYAMNHFV